MNRSKLFSALAAACLLTATGAVAQGPKPVHTVAPKAAVTAAITTTDTTKKKPPVVTHKKKGHKPVKPDTTKIKKPN